MKISIVLILVALNLFHSPAQASTDSGRTEYYETWCRKVGSILRIAVGNTTYATTYQEEKSMLLDAVERSIQETPEKGHFYFLTSLRVIPNGMANYERIEEQVTYLRRTARYALEDLTYIDESIYRSRLCGFCDLDHSPYVMKVLARSLEEGRAAKTDEQETFALDLAADMGITLLDDSAFRRDYACARKEMGYALDASNLLNKRDHVREAWSILYYKNRCRL